ncbi:MAG: phosphoribosylformylglycinamidine synthase [Flavobacteriales bacterium]|nr:phosphoribosylformylglycinamidine synthase [Flavobacteriales bacterium]
MKAKRPKIITNFMLFVFFPYHLKGQIISDSSSFPKEILDSLYIFEVEEKQEPEKVLHAEPLFFDLIRDLGARKGEREWNIGWGLTDNFNYDKYDFLIEYEWAPIHRLGLELELPFTFYYSKKNGSAVTNSNKLNSLKFALQYSFFVSAPLKTSIAAGYLHELVLTSFRNYGKGRLLEGNIYNPFFVAAKRWGKNFHTLLITGPHLFHNFTHTSLSVNWHWNSNVHYMISGTRNFLGVELNKELLYGKFHMIIRPQMRLSVSENVLAGIVAGIPVARENERLGTFLRLIYEPGFKKSHTRNYNKI